MQRSMLAPRAMASTQQVPVAQRLEFWEAHNASTLIGLTCSTHHPEGLQASERNFDLGEVRLTEIVGNQHVIERPRRMLQTHPKEALFACVLLEGSAFFFQNDACVTLTAGDVIAYGTDVPYLYGFTGNMRQIIIEADFVALEGVGWQRPRAVVKLDHRVRGGGWLAHALRHTALGFLQKPYRDDAPRVAARARCLLQALAGAGSGSRQIPQALADTATWRLLQADLFVADHLGQSDLNAVAVAQAVGVSVRHLNRLFASRGCTVQQWLTQQRLARARDELAQGPRAGTITNIAYRWGFATPAHFTRLFKQTYGTTPTDWQKYRGNEKIGDRKSEIGDGNRGKSGTGKSGTDPIF